MYKHELKSNVSQIQGLLGIPQTNCVHIAGAVSVSGERLQLKACVAVDQRRWEDTVG